VREHEVRASSAERCGQKFDAQLHQRVYTPQHGASGFGKKLHSDEPHRAAVMGIARTFQSWRCSKGMSVLDNS